MLDKLLI